MFIKVSKILTKIILYTVVGLLLLAVLGTLALRSSYLQTKIAQYYAPKISKALGYPIEIDKITIRFFACWEKKDHRFSNKEGFDSYLQETADKLANPIEIIIDRNNS